MALVGDLSGNSTHFFKILKFNLFVCVLGCHLYVQAGVSTLFLRQGLSNESNESLELTNFARLSRHQALEILQCPPSQVFTWVLDIKLRSSCTQVDTTFSCQRMCNRCAFIGEADTVDCSCQDCNILDTC